MSDPFIDALHDRLKAAGATSHDDGDRSAAVDRWWAEFVEVLGQKVGAWNERQAPHTPLNFTKQADGAVHVWHRSAEATFARSGNTIRVTTRLGAQRGREANLDVEIARDQHLIALLDGEELATPSAAVEHLLTPLFVETFTKP